MRRTLSVALVVTGLGLGAAWAQPAPSYRVPYRLTETQHLLVRAKVNGKGPFNFIVDTGAPALYLSPDAAKKAGLTAGKDGWAPVQRLELEGQVVLEKVEARLEEPPQLTGMNAMGLAGARLDGIFGYTILSRFRMEIDLSQPAMRWTPVPYQPKPLVGLEELSGKKPLPPNPNAGMLQMVARLASVLFARAPEGPPAYRGLLGFELVAEPEAVRVGAVLVGSPAAAAGLHAGDRILRAGAGAAVPAPVKTPDDLLKTAGLEPDQELVLEVEREGKPVRITLRAAKGAF